MRLYPFTGAEKAQQRNVKRACELLKVSRSACYQARGDEPSDRERDDAELAEQVKKAHEDSKGRYGPRGSTRSCAPRGSGTRASGSPG